MLKEYFGIGITPNGCLTSLPLYFPAFVPDISALPRFLLRLSTQVAWTFELDCLRSVARELARLYAPALPSPCAPTSNVFSLFFTPSIFFFSKNKRVDLDQNRKRFESMLILGVKGNL